MGVLGIRECVVLFVMFRCFIVIHCAVTVVHVRGALFSNCLNVARKIENNNNCCRCGALINFTTFVISLLLLNGISISSFFHTYLALIRSRL